MAFPSINNTLLSNDLTYLMVYANDVTNSVFGWAITLGFFLTVLLGSFFMQFRFNPTNPRFDTSLLASSFATIGWVTIIEQSSGILSPIHFMLVIGVFILSLLWVIFGAD